MTAVFRYVAGPAKGFHPLDLGPYLAGLIDFANTPLLTVDEGTQRITGLKDTRNGSSWAEVSSAGPTLDGDEAVFAGAQYLQQATVNAAYPLTGAMEIWSLCTQSTPADSSGDTRLIAFGSAAANWLAIGRRQNTKPYNQAYVETANTRLLADPNGATFDGEHIVRAVWDGSTQSIGLDGGGPNGAPVAVTQSGNNTRARLGASAGTSAASFFVGRAKVFAFIRGNLPAKDTDRLNNWLLRRKNT